MNEELFCDLEIEIRECPNLDEGGIHCNNEDTKCSFLRRGFKQPTDIKTEYIRPKRWYEQYNK